MTGIREFARAASGRSRIGAARANAQNTGLLLGIRNGVAGGANVTNKYRNTKIQADGMTFDSKREWRRYSELKLLLRAGVISELQRQVSYMLVPSQRINGKVAERPVQYVADFVYKDKNGGTVVEDVKGVRTKDYIIKRKLMLWVHGIKITEVQ